MKDTQVELAEQRPYFGPSTSSSHIRLTVFCCCCLTNAGCLALVGADRFEHVHLQRVVAWRLDAPGDRPVVDAGYEWDVSVPRAWASGETGSVILGVKNTGGVPLTLGGWRVGAGDAEGVPEGQVATLLTLVGWQVPGRPHIIMETPLMRERYGDRGRFQDPPLNAALYQSRQDGTERREEANPVELPAGTEGTLAVIFLRDGRGPYIIAFSITDGIAVVWYVLAFREADGSGDRP